MMKAVFVTSSPTVCAASSWEAVPSSENIWYIKDGMCIGGSVKTKAGIRKMSPEEMEIKLQFLQNSPQLLGIVKYSSADDSIGSISLSNWERIVYVDSRFVHFEFSGKFPKK